MDLIPEVMADIPEKTVAEYNLRRNKLKTRHHSDHNPEHQKVLMGCEYADAHI